MLADYYRRASDIIIKTFLRSKKHIHYQFLREKYNMLLSVKNESIKDWRLYEY